VGRCQRVEGLLHAHEEAGNFLDKTAPERLATDQAASSLPVSNSRFAGSDPNVIHGAYTNGAGNKGL
jgi:hypothetical protein